MNNQLLTVINSILEQKSNQLSGDDFFSLISIITLIKIIDIYTKNENKLIQAPEKQADTGNLAQILTQFQQGDSPGDNNLQQLLPILLNVLGSKKNTGKYEDSNSIQNNETTGNSNNEERNKNNKSPKAEKKKLYE